MIEVEVRHWHGYCGLGAGAKGFNKGRAELGNVRAKFRCLGGVDVDPAAVADFGRIAGVPGMLLDLFSAEQYIAFHGHLPAPDWREATVDDIRRSAGGERPHIVFMSAPCKGFSGLLSEKMSQSVRYQALNELTLRGIWLMLEAWGDDPPELIVFENVPRIATRGRPLLLKIIALLQSYGYAVAETTHDCGEIGELAQSRKRFLLVARHMAKVPPFLYEPPKRRLKGVGEVLECLPLPGDLSAGPMHRMPALQWKTWVRLAFVEAGSDWRSLNRLSVTDGVLADYGIVPAEGFRSNEYGVNRWDETAGVVTSARAPGQGKFSVADPRQFGRHNTVLGVRAWSETTGAVTGNSRPMTGTFSVADPRIDGHPKSVQFGVRTWEQQAGVVTGNMWIGSGPNAVADPRIEGKPRFNNVFRIVQWGDHSPAVAGPGGPAGGLAVADPRAPAGSHATKYRVTAMHERSGAVIAASTTGQGAFAVADPRTGWKEGAHESKLRVTPFDRHVGAITGSAASSHGFTSGAMSVADPRPAYLKDGRESYRTAGMYGVVPWEGAAGAVQATGQHDNGRWSVADPRAAEGDAIQALPAPADRLVAVIQSMDGTWHRPFTTLELAALQSLIDPEEHLELEGLSDAAWRERIGNAVPPAAAAAIASVMGKTLLMAWSGQTFLLSNEPIWVQPIAVALSVSPSLPAE